MQVMWGRPDFGSAPFAYPWLDVGWVGLIGESVLLLLAAVVWTVLRSPARPGERMQAGAVGAAGVDRAGSDVADVQADAGARGRVAVRAMDESYVHQAGLPGVQREPDSAFVWDVGHALYAEGFAALGTAVLAGVVEVPDGVRAGKHLQAAVDGGCVGDGEPCGETVQGRVAYAGWSRLGARARGSCGRAT